MRFKRICVFCGSSPGGRPSYREAAQSLGQELARREIELVYGGGCVGLMGVLADAVMGAGGRVVGVIPAALVAREVAHRGLSELRVVASMHERKATMAEMADAFIALPGGFGTFEEFCEIITWTQLGLHRKPHGLLNVEHFYDPLLALFDHAVAERFIQPEYRQLVKVAGTPSDLIGILERTEMPAVEKWIDRSGT